MVECLFVCQSHVINCAVEKSARGHGETPNKRGFAEW